MKPSTFTESMLGNNSQPGFITMADTKFVQPLSVSVKQALKFYPDSRYYIYDCGLTEGDRDALRAISPNVVITNWPLLYLPVTLTYTPRFLRMKAAGMARDYLLSICGINNEQRSIKTLIKQSHLEIFFQNKLAIIKHHNDNIKGSFIFLDADAFLINPIDELFDNSFDLGVTLRRPVEHSYAQNNCRLLNVGVMLFLGDNDTNQKLIASWYARARQTKELYSEQTSLTRLLLEKNPDLLKTHSHTDTISIDNTPVRVRVLDCDTYNFSWLEEFVVARDAKHIKILHFKNERFTTPLFKEIASALEIDI